MALSAALVFEGRAATGNDNNGGGWGPLTIFSGSNLVVDGSLNTKVTSVTHNFVAADVNGVIQISNALPSSWIPGFYTINSVASNAAILSASPAPVGTTSGTWGLTGVDRSQQNGVQVAIDNSIITTSITANVITFTGYTPTVADVGNVVQMLTGTNVTAGLYAITGFTSTTWTVAGTAALPTSGTTTNATGNMGGALATLAKLASAMTGSNKGYATGAFTSAATVTFAQSVTPTATAPHTRLIGYGASRTDGIHATLTLSTNTGLTGISMTGNGFKIENIDVDCASLGTSTGISGSGAYCEIANCKASNFTTRGITLTSGGANGAITACEATAGTAAATAAIDLQLSVGAQCVLRSHVHDNSCPGIKMNNGCIAVGNLVTNNSGASSDGITYPIDGLVINNTVHASGRDGIRASQANSIKHLIRNNLLTQNAGYGITLTTSTAYPANPSYDGNAYYLNTSGTRQGMDSTAGIFGVNPYVNVRDVLLSVSPYVGPTSGGSANFALNATATGGAACRAAASPASWPGNTGTAGYPDMGAVQHQDTPAMVPRVMVVSGETLPVY